MGSGTAAPLKRGPLVGFLLVLPTLVVIVSWLVLRERLPGTLATHWGPSMEPDGFSLTSATLLICLAISVLGAGMGLVAMSLQSLGWRTGLLFTGGLAAWCAATIWLVSAATGAAAGDPEQARLDGWFLVLILGSLLGISPAWLSGAYGQLNRSSQYQRQLRIAQAQGKPLPQPLPIPDVPLRRTVNAPAWIWALSLALVLLVGWITWLAFADQGPGSEGIVGMLVGPVILLLTLPLLLGLCRIHVQVDDRGLQVSSALLGFGMRKIALEEIKDVETGHVDPMQWGGWGWRFFPGGSAIVFKATDGLIVHTESGKRFAITMEDSEQVRDQLLARRTAGPSARR